MDERELSYGASGFALQFQLDTSLSDALRFPLRLSDLIVMDLDPSEGPMKVIYGRGPATHIQSLDGVCVGLKGDRFFGPADIGRGEHGEPLFAPYSGRLLVIDPSGRGRDETAWCVVFALNGTLFLMDQGGFRDGYGPATLQALADIAKKWKVNAVQIEANFGDGMFKSLLTPFCARTHPVAIEEVRSTGMKEARIIDTLEPIFNQHRLVVNRPVVEADYHSTSKLPIEQQARYRLFYQITRITKDKGSLAQDDRVDALAQACAYWVRSMAADQEAKSAEFVRERMREAIEAQYAFMKELGPKDPGRESEGWLKF